MSISTKRSDGILPARLRGLSRAYSDRVSYIPDQEDDLGVAVTEAVRYGPYYLAIRDLVTCVRMFTLFPGVITPVLTQNPQDEFYPWGFNLFGLIVLTIASVAEVILIMLAVPLFLFLPGPFSVIIFVCGQVGIHIICWPIQGPSKVYSKTPTDQATIDKYEKVKGERWFFLNGCCVSGHNVQQNVDVLAELFGRPIFGIHNRTYGVLGDLFECIMQRAFDIFSEETRVCYEYIKAYCADPQVSKVVIIAHSQGCIMASQILDQLYVDLPWEAVAKLEVYTFGNAASHFNNPLRKISPTAASLDARDLSHSPNDSTSIMEAPDNKPSHMTPWPNPSHVIDKHKTWPNPRNNNGNPKPHVVISEMLPERVIPHIEHYCNSGDMVTRWGALFSAKSILSNRFCGHIFINEGANGHMLNQHYLSEMFPTQNHHHHQKQRAGQGKKKTRVPFLDRLVKLDTATVTQRQGNAVHELAVMRHDSASRDHDEHAHIAHAAPVGSVEAARSKADFDKLTLTLGEGTKLSSKDLSGAEGSRISVVRAHGEGEQAEQEEMGKTVRQLSRLWRYLDGGDPDITLARRKRV